MRHAIVAAALLLGLTGCSGWDPRDPFARRAPEVDRAITLMEAGADETADPILDAYLASAGCEGGQLEVNERMRLRPDAAFDLGLVLFALGERVGEPLGAEKELDDEEVARRVPFARCAGAVLGAIASDARVEAALRARARYLHGNVFFSLGDYKRAVEHYDLALRLVPAVPDGTEGDTVGVDAAKNRAIALRRIEEAQPPPPPPQPQPQPQQPQPQPPQPEPQDEPEPQEPDAGDEPPPAPKDPGEQDPKPQEPDDGEPKDPGKDQPAPAKPEGEGDEPDDGDAAGDRAGEAQRDRVLDQFEQVPTYQEEEARRKGQGRRRSMEDK